VQRTQSIGFSTTPPTGARTGGSYQVLATGGGSGNPVVLTIDPAAAAVCRISGNIVTFIGAGTCIINANQAGNDRYAAAPQVQQSFTVQKKATTYLTLNATPEPADKGETIKAKAKLRTASGPLVNRTVRFYFRAKGASGWTYRAKDLTNSRGIALRKFTARRTGDWQARYSGSSSYLSDKAIDRVRVID
jgi:hypothetical protein